MTRARLEALGSELATCPKLTSEWGVLTVNQRINAMWESIKIFDRYFELQVGTMGIVVEGLPGFNLGSVSTVGEITVASESFEHDNSSAVVGTITHEYQHLDQQRFGNLGAGLRARLVRANWKHYVSAQPAFDLMGRVCRLQAWADSGGVVGAVKSTAVTTALSPYLAALSVAALVVISAYLLQPVEMGAYRAEGITKRAMLRTLKSRSQIAANPMGFEPEMPLDRSVSYEPSEHVLYWAAQSTLTD